MGRVFNYVSLAVLLGGLVVGVILVQTSQELRRFAGEEHKVKLCHQTGSGQNTIEVDENAIPAHLEHGDSVGDCPSAPPPTDAPPPATETPTQPPATLAPTAVPTQAPTQQPTQAPTQAPTATPAPTSTPSGTGGQAISQPNSSSTTNVTVNVTNTGGSTGGSDASSTPIPSTPTSSQQQLVTTSASDGSTFVFNIAFQGVFGQGANKKVRVSFKQNEDVVYLFDDVLVSANDKGVYSGRLEGIVPGTYDVVVKGEGHLAKKFTKVAVVRGVNTWNWGTIKLRAGDFDGNNRLDVFDIALLLAPYTQLSVELDEGNSYFDIDGNGVLEAKDIVVVLTNYNQLEIIGDE